MTKSWLVMVLAIAGCSNLRDRGDTLYKQRKFDEAASAYDAYLAAHPGDKKALAGRRAARNQQLRAQIAKVQRERVAGLGRDSARDLASALGDRDTWSEHLDADLASAIELEVADASARIGSEVAAQTADVGPLAGEAKAREYGSLLDKRDFATTRDALHTQLTEAGRVRCAHLVANEASPYVAWLVAQYCGHYNITREVPALPEQRRALVVEGPVASESARQIADLQSAMTTRFEQSPWFAPTAAHTAHATIDGSLEVHESAHPVTLTAAWSESVPYTAYETQQESYQEPYDDTETYYESVPSTEYRTETTPCGDTTCTNTVPETVYHDELKTRTVTKYRTAYRDVTVPVTRYRDVGRSQDYNAIQRAATYHSNLRVRIDDGLPAISATVDKNTSESGYDHDVTISAAGVSPSRANLTTHDEFASVEQARLGDAFASWLDRGYRERFCAAASYTVDEAARCAYASTKDLPDAATAALHPLLGGEAPFVGLLGR